MTSELYQEIFLDSFIPFMAGAYNFDCTLHQDNDPKHKSKLLRNLYEENDVDWVSLKEFFRKKSHENLVKTQNKKISTPPNSPDLNPIEMVWHEMKTYVRNCFCKTPEEVSTAIENFRRSLTLEKLRNYIMKIKEVKNHLAI